MSSNFILGIINLVIVLNLGKPLVCYWLTDSSSFLSGIKIKSSETQNVNHFSNFLADFYGSIASKEIITK